VNTDLEQVRNILKSHLNQATPSRVLSDSIRIQQVADPADMTQEAAERDVAVQILDREATFIRQLRAAIDRIDNGSYGFCLECEDEIAPKRLKAIPWAERCIGCQDTADRLASSRKYAVSFQEGAEAA
jgi:RNA polymerase-binding transcription factor